ncbi:hypothetical protein G6O67_001480 [Ophiocordyceps sinensis]|nr:hypothetical protein G6O67_001480 [Ophiocordyceps sinensis]
MLPSGGRGNGPSGGQGDKRPQTDAQSVQEETGKPYQPDLPGNGQQLLPRTRTTAATARTTFGQRAVSAHGRPGASSENALPSASPAPPPRIRTNVLPPGLERAMQEFRAAGRSYIPAPGTPGRPVMSGPGRRAFSDSTHPSAAVPAASGSPSEDELSKIREIIEEAVEQQAAAALAPLRVVVNELNKVIQAASQENSDLREQNDTLSRQIDLHYRDIQQHSEIASTHIRALTNLVSAHTQINRAANENLAVTCTLVGHLSQVIANIPQSLSQVVQGVVVQAIQSALSQIAAAEQEALDSIRAFLSGQFANLESRQAAAFQLQLQQQLRQRREPEHSQGSGREVQQESEGVPRGFGKIKAMLSKKPKSGPE